MASVSTPSDFSFQVDPSALNPGKYKGLMMIKTTDRVGAWIDIPIKLNVTHSMVNGEKNFLPTIIKPPGGIITYPEPYRIIYQRQYFLDRQLIRIDSDGENFDILSTNLPQVNQVAVSPDGSKITLALVGENNKLFIWILDGVTGNRILEINIGNMSRSPVFSPKGDQLLFISNIDNDQGEVYRINIDGSNLTRLTNNAWQETAVYWSPQGDKIAVGINWWKIIIMNPDGTGSYNLEQVFPSQDLKGWSPDGNKILMRVTQDYISSGELWVYDLQANRYRYIDRDIKQYGQAAWSPDGNRIAYIKGSYNNWFLYGDILSTGQSIQLVGTIPEGDSDGPYWSWSPNGEWIVISKPRAIDSGNDDIYVVNRNGTESRVLTTNIKDDLMPSWQPLK
jgi:Tol biopolymer transport system component